MGDSRVQEVSKRARKCHCSLIANDEYSVETAVSTGHGSHLTDDVGVNTTTKTLVSGEWDEEPFFDWEVGFLFSEICLILYDFLDRANSECFGPVKSGYVLLHF